MTTIIELQSILQNLKNCRISYTDIGKALGTKRANISKRAKTGSIVTDEEIKEIEEFYKIDISKHLISKQDTNGFIPDDKIEINYWSELPDELKNPKIRSVWFDKEIIQNAWSMSSDNLFLIPMFGDALSHYWYPVYSGDILIIDASQNKILECGLYFATSQNNTRYWIREIDILANEAVEFRRYSSGGKIVKTYNRQELKDADFRVIGKVIKNVSFRL